MTEMPWNTNEAKSEWKSDVLKEWTVTTAKTEEKALERAVTWVAWMKSYVEQFWDAQDKETTKDESEEWAKSEKIKQEIDDLRKKKDWWWLLARAWDVIDHFFGSFFWKKWSKKWSADVLFTKIKEMPQEVDFTSMDNDTLVNTIDDLQKQVKDESHLFKRLHFMWMQSRAKDALDKKDGKKTETPYDRIANNLHDGDIILLWNNGDFWNGKLTSKAKNPFAHIGVYHQWKFYHSTMDWSIINPAWWVAVDMKEYIEKTKPRGCMVMRAQDNWSKIGEKAKTMVDSWSVQYDQLGAWSDLNGWWNWMGSRYNCGEFVGAVLEATTWIDVPDDKDALPWTYEKMPGLNPVYMDWYTG